MTGRGLSLIPVACAALAAFVALPAIAQETLYLGRKPGAVTIDQSVLDDLGAPPTLPQLLMPGRVQQAAPAAPSGPVHLVPPAKGKKTAKAAKAAPKEAPVPRAAKGPKTNPPPPAVAAAAKGASVPEVPPPPPPPAPAPAASSPPAPPAPVTPAAAPPSSTQPGGGAPPPTAAPSPPPAQTASRPTGAAPLGADGVRIAFDGAQTELSEAGKQALSGIADKMQADEQLRLQLLAYASGGADQASQARRTSLSRALAARTFLLEKGVRSTRIDVRALGNTGDEQPADRVDAVLAKR